MAYCDFVTAKVEYQCTFDELTKKAHFLGVGDVQNAIGSSETGLPTGISDFRVGSVYLRPVAGVEYRVVGDNGIDLPHGQMGWLQQKVGDTALDGYFADPNQLTAILRSDGWYQMGEAAVANADGTFYVPGRVEQKSFIGKDGERHYLFGTEVALLSVSGVGKAEVLHTEQGVVAHIVPQNPSDVGKPESLIPLLNSAVKDVDPQTRPLAYRFWERFGTSAAFKRDVALLRNTTDGFVKA